MSAPEYARLTIDFDLQADPIAGLVRDDGGHGQPFAGWMALTPPSSSPSRPPGGPPARMIPADRKPPMNTVTCRQTCGQKG